MYLTRNQSISIAVLLIVLFFIFGSFFIKDDQSPVTLTTDTNNNDTEITKSNEPTFALADFHRSEIDKDGRKVWEVKAKQGQYFPASNSAEVKDATVWFYREDQENAVVIKTDEATLFLNGTELTRANLYGNVSMDYAGEFLVTTAEAIYMKSENKVYAPGFVNIKNERYDIQGKELNAMLENRHFELQHEVESVLHPNAEIKN